MPGIEEKSAKSWKGVHQRKLVDVLAVSLLDEVEMFGQSCPLVNQSIWSGKLLQIVCQ